ncbi:MAG: 50S ribosomal protein L21 [Fibrobacterota bacterium]|nr:50S ribosomal protein L21 [Fibrobacterota bacterium]
MYSVIECGGFQHKITVGETLKVPKMDAKVGDVVTISNVLLFVNGETLQVGAPLVSGVAVKLEVLDQGKGDKVLSFKRKARKRYRKTIGHRQLFTEVLVTEIAFGSDKSAVDEKAKLRARARIKALAAQKVQNVPLTRAQKVAAAAKEGK